MHKTKASQFSGSTSMLGRVLFACVFVMTAALPLYIPAKVRAITTTPSSISTAEGGDRVPLEIRPNIEASYASNGSVIYLLVIPDAYSDVGRGPGATQTIKAIAENGRWELQEIESQYGTSQIFNDQFTSHVAAFDDDQINGTHQSTITVAYRCDTDMSQYPPHETRTTITNTITDNDSPGSITGSPVGSTLGDPPCLVPETGGTLGQATDTTPTVTPQSTATTQENAQPATPTPSETPSAASSNSAAGNSSKVSTPITATKNR